MIALFLWSCRSQDSQSKTGLGQRNRIRANPKSTELRPQFGQQQVKSEKSDDNSAGPSFRTSNFTIHTSTVSPEFTTIRPTPQKRALNLYRHNSAKNATTMRPVTATVLINIRTDMDQNPTIGQIVNDQSKISQSFDTRLNEIATGEYRLARRQASHVEFSNTNSRMRWCLTRLRISSRLGRTISRTLFAQNARTIAA